MGIGVSSSETLWNLFLYCETVFVKGTPKYIPRTGGINQSRLFWELNTQKSFFSCPRSLATAGWHFPQLPSSTRSPRRRWLLGKPSSTLVWGRQSCQMSMGSETPPTPDTLHSGSQTLVQNKSLVHTDIPEQKKCPKAKKTKDLVTMLIITTKRIVFASTDFHFKIFKWYTKVVSVKHLELTSYKWAKTLLYVFHPYFYDLWNLDFLQY